MENKIHTGQMFKDFIDSKLLHRTTVAQWLNTPSTAIYAYEKRPFLHCRTLLRICMATKHNFFMDIANMLPDTFTHKPGPISDKNKLEFEKIKTEKDKLIAEQAAEIARLSAENNLMKELIKLKM